MPITKPYIRTSRQLADGSYANSGNGEYIKDKRYAIDPQHFIRAYLLLQKDVMELFDYIEPSDQNLNAYSYRTHEILVRACIEVETNCKSIMLENIFAKRPQDMTMGDYKLIEKSHRMSAYEVSLPHWKGERGTFKPFWEWRAGGALPWYQAYNNTKHNRSELFHEATFEKMLGAVGGLVSLLAAQFQNKDFMSLSENLTVGNSSGLEESIGGYFQVKYPSDWPENDRYNFQWQNLRNEKEPFQKFDFNAIAATRAAA